MNTHTDNEELRKDIRKTKVYQAATNSRYPDTETLRRFQKNWEEELIQLFAKSIPKPQSAVDSTKTRSTGTPTKSSGELDPDNPLQQILVEVYFSDLTTGGKEKTILKAEAAILSWHTTQTTKLQAEARIDELKEFEPLQRNHDKCLDPMSCIGYQNAASDFDNEKHLRIEHLEREHKIGEDDE